MGTSSNLLQSHSSLLHSKVLVFSQDPSVTMVNTKPLMRLINDLWHALREENEAEEATVWHKIKEHPDYISIHQPTV